MPLPPYIKRDDRPTDRERYQTVFARERGSVAAPTAGLHFTPALNASLAARGIDIAEITLHVGYGTFQPVRVERVEDHRLEAERYDDQPSRRRRRSTARSTKAAASSPSARRRRGRSRRWRGRTAGGVVAGSGRDGPLHLSRVRVPRRRGTVTNFHLPRSSLLMLVAAFAGASRVLAAYAAAIAGGTGSTATATRC